MGAMDDHNKRAAKERAKHYTRYKPQETDWAQLARFLGDQSWLSAHKACDHWRVVGRCVFCSCGQRLFQGSLPKPDINITVVDE